MAPAVPGLQRLRPAPLPAQRLRGVLYVCAAGKVPRRGTRGASNEDMPNRETEGSSTKQPWENAREAEETDACAAGVGCELAAHHACPRGSECRCARPIGPSIPLIASRPVP
jgi:hypothetical protein